MLLVSVGAVSVCSLNESCKILSLDGLSEAHVSDGFSPLVCVKLNAFFFVSLLRHWWLRSKGTRPNWMSVRPILSSIAQLSR